MFYEVIRVYHGAAEGWRNSIQYFFLDDYASVDEMLKAAKARYHNILAADLQNTSLDYCSCMVVDNSCHCVADMREVFDSRTVEAEEAEE